MNWFDIFSILFLVITAYSGSKRGLILELFDVLILIIGLGLTLHLYLHLSKFILSVLPWNEDFSKWVSFFVIFAIIAGLTMFAALLIDKAVKLAVVLKSVNTYGGLIVGAFKGIFLLTMILIMIAAIPINKVEKAKINNSIAAKAVWSVYPMMKGIFDIVSPTYVNDFLEKITKESNVLKEYGKKATGE